MFAGQFTDPADLGADVQKFFYQVQLSLIFFQGLIDPADHVVYALPADAQVFRHLAEGLILKDHTFIYLLLAPGQQLSIKIIQKRLLYKLFHLHHLGYHT